MRTFILDREVDVTGISGSGVVAEGVEFSDGITVVRWLPAGTARPTEVKPTTVIFDNITHVLALHGHNGSTKVVYLEEPR